MQRLPSAEQIEAVREYLRTRAWRRGAQRTADQYSVSRSTLWRFLWTDHVSPKLVAAVTAEVGESTWELRRAAERLRPMSGAVDAYQLRPRLTGADKQTIEALCHTPLSTVDEMAAFIRLPANTLRERLARLAGKRLADSRPHRLQLLGTRPQRRFFPTREGVVGLAGGSRAGIERLMRLYPVSRQWFRVLAERLDAVAALYRAASKIAALDAGEAPVVVTHCRTGPYDLLLRLPSGGTVGLVRQGPLLTNASLRYRIRTIERMDPFERPLLTLILTDSEQDMRRVLRAIADPSTHTETLVAVAGDVIADQGEGRGEPRVWQQGGYGFASTPTLEPDVPLSTIVAHAHRLAEAYPSLRRSPMRQPSSASRNDLPDPAEQLEQAPSLRLSRAEKRALDLLAGWPFCSPAQLAGLMDGVSERRANQVLHALRKHGLIQREELGYLLTDAGLTTLARRDRAAVGPTLDRSTPVRDDEGYIGSLVQTAANQHRHQAGVAEFCARLSAEAARSPDHELLDLLPTQRSQISYEHQWTRYPLYPDASFQLSYQGDWHWCLVEFERRATTPRRVPERLRAYRRYFGSDYVRPDHGGQLPLVLFVFETERAESTFLDTAEQLSPAPFLSSNLDAIEAHGVLGRSWRAWGARVPDRHRLEQYGQLLGQAPTAPTTRAQQFR
ncbi:MAG: replication-relaxation family protein [Chloroflexi bacterium]|nr:replication-relaxation family protein [Chloroflexota bacterium]